MGPVLPGSSACPMHQSPLSRIVRTPAHAWQKSFASVRCAAVGLASLTSGTMQLDSPDASLHVPVVTQWWKASAYASLSAGAQVPMHALSKACAHDADAHRVR
jgi:hypothetical protein